MSQFLYASVKALKEHLVCDSCNPATAPPTIVVTPSCRTTPCEVPIIVCSEHSQQTATIRNRTEKCDDCHRNTYLLAAHLWSIAAYGRERRDSQASHSQASQRGTNVWPSRDIDLVAQLTGDASKQELRKLDLTMSEYAFRQAGCKNPSRVMQRVQSLNPSDAGASLYVGLRSVVDQASDLVNKTNIAYPNDDDPMNEKQLSLVGQYISNLEGTLTFDHLWSVLGTKSVQMYLDGKPGQPSLAEAVLESSAFFDPIHFMPTDVAMNGPHWDAVLKVGKGDVFHGFRKDE